MIRQAAVAGQFYPGRPGELREMIRKMTDAKADRKEVIGVVSPHAGFVYSGPVAGAVFSSIKLTDTVIIIGPNHRGLGKPLSITTSGSWETPLGEVQIDSGLAKAILSSSTGLEEDTLAHRYEHSLEVQVPFLQYFKPDVKVVPIVLAQASPQVFQGIGRAIAGTLKSRGEAAVIVASSDMTHYEPHESAKAKDKMAIEAILSLDVEELVRRIGKYDISMCGYAPVISLIAAALEMKAGKAELVKYQTSGDTSGDYTSVVGYAGIVIGR